MLKADIRIRPASLSLIACRDRLLFLVVANSAVLISDSREESVLLKRLVVAGARPKVGYLVDLSLSSSPHDLLSEREALFAFDVLQMFTLQIGMRCEDAVRGVGAKHIKVTVLKATLG
jgi:hypothetical protein